MKQQTAAISKAPLRILACMLSLLLGMLLWSGSTLSASASQVGDVDGDGFITVQDATLILEMYAKTSADISMNLSNEMVTTADVDDDGMISMRDAIMVLEYYAKQAAGLAVNWNILQQSEAEKTAWFRSQKVLEYVNQYRTENGLSTLSYNETLYQAATIRAKELKQSFSHSRPNGKSAFSILDEMDIFYMSAGENIAAGFNTPKSAFTAWINSTGHRANILGGYTSAAVGVYIAPDETCYWCLMLIGD